MNQNRQQAMGNIYNSLYNGARLFVRDDNPVSSFLSDKQFVFSKCEDLLTKKTSVFQSLDLSEKQQNRALIHALLNNTYIDSQIKNICKIFSGNDL